MTSLPECADTPARKGNNWVHSARAQAACPQAYIRHCGRWVLHMHSQHAMRACLQHRRQSGPARARSPGAHTRVCRPPPAAVLRTAPHPYHAANLASYNLPEIVLLYANICYHLQPLCSILKCALHVQCRCSHAWPYSGAWPSSMMGHAFVAGGSQAYSLHKRQAARTLPPRVCISGGPAYLC